MKGEHTVRKQIPIPQDDSMRYTILSLIAICGEFPVDQLSRLTGGERYKENVIKDLKAYKWIHTYYADQYRAFRLSRNGKTMLLAKNPNRFQFWLTGANDTNHLKSEIMRRLRLRRIAEATVTMMNAGVRIYRDEKPDVFSGKPLSTDFSIIEPAFFNSREIKAMGTVTVKIHGARSVGVLLAEDDLFVVYNLGGALMRWDYKAEMRTKALLTHTLCFERLREQYSSDCVRALLLGNTMEMAYKVLTIASNTPYTIHEDSYEHFYFLTNDKQGERLLQLLCNRFLCEQLNDILMTDLEEQNPASAIENDAFTEDGVPVLFAHTFNLPRIKRFMRGLDMHGVQGMIICFDYQKEVLERYMGERVCFQTISFAKWEREFFGKTE